MEHEETMDERLSDLTALARRISELYAERFDVERDATWYLGKMTEELGEVTSAYLKLSGQGRVTGSRRNLEDEVADLLGFVLLFADWQGIDPAEALQRKWGRYLEAQDA
ncbi:MAG: MazG nucleotide pyrophosphohydrolase domain-containing protein [Falsiruegeria mediterranea]